MTEITRLDHARVLKRMKVPLNTPVEEREFSAAYTDHWVDLVVAQAKFIEAIQGYSEKARPGRWRTVKRRFNSLNDAAMRCVAFLGELRSGGDTVASPSQLDLDQGFDTFRDCFGRVAEKGRERHVREDSKDKKGCVGRWRN